MKKTKTVLLILLLLSMFMTGCTAITINEENTTDKEIENEISFTYTADFYDNFGERWLSVEGKSFSISPNKIKTYGWNPDGSWVSSYETSSLMSIEIDGSYIESCGSTIIFADSRLEKCDVDFDTKIVTNYAGDFNDPNIVQPSDIRMEDWWTIQHWWCQKSLNNDNHNERLVIIQSQLGNPICIYSGNDVSWDIPKNLPNTTMILIDGKVLYVHRANFSIIDTSLLQK